MHAHRWPRILGFLIWLLVGLSAAFWGLRLGDSTPAMTESAAARPAGVDPARVLAALGGAPVQAAVGVPAAAPARRVELLGVITEGRRGVAVLSIDGQPGRPYLVGDRLDEGRVLKAVGRRHAELASDGAGAALERLELPMPALAELPAGVKLLQAGRP